MSIVIYARNLWHRKPPRLCSGRTFASDAGGHGFDPLPGHNNTLEMVVMITPYYAKIYGGSNTTD